MPKPTDITIKNVVARFEKHNYRTPMKFGGRVVTDVDLLNVSIDVETGDGRTATGECSVPLGNVWGWPSQVLDATQTLAAMRSLSEACPDVVMQNATSGHPLEITHLLATAFDKKASEISQSLAESMPKLAQLVCTSPFEGAIHDAYGKALGESAYNVLGAEFANVDLAHFLNDDFAGEHLDAYTLRKPKPSMPLYHLVGALDPLDDAEVEKPVGDGLPETLGEWILADRLTHMKIKLSGEDMAWDVARVAKVEAVAVAAQEQRGAKVWHYSCDFNEKCASVDYVLEFLAKLEETSPAALDRVQYIEQPTHRDLRSNPENRMHKAAAIKPVVIDESLVDFETLLLSREQGYSGVALKACKGHSEALLMGAAAQKYKMFLCVQDLTCVGASFLHSASLAARIPTVAAIEGNGRQYCPAGNQGWEKNFPGMFEITDGTVATGELDGVGLGF